jgi:hypothetical protein
LRASNPEAHESEIRRAAPNFAKRNQARLIRRFSIGFAAIAVLSVPVLLNFVGQGGAGDEVQISSEVVDDAKGATQKDGPKKSGKKSTKKTKSVSFTGAPSLELGARPTELVGADQNFRSVRDGFSFPNYAGQPTNDAIDASTMAALFGKEAVCADQNAALCVMSPGAQAVADQLNEAMASGRCEGMSVLAQRFYDGYEARPNGVATTVQVAQNSVAKQIGYWWATQVAPSVAANSKTYRAMTPVQITTEIINGLRARSGFTLGLYSSVGGHSVTPIAVTQDGNNFNIYVYDNNYPTEIRKVLVDSATQTWTYSSAAISSSAAKSTWTGSGPGTMDLTSMASRQGPFSVSFGGTKGVKGLTYSVIVTQKGNTSEPVGLKISSRFGEVNSLDPKSVSTSKFPVKSFLGAGVGQGAIAYIPTVLAEEDGLDLEIVGGTKTGEYVVSVMRTGSAGVVVESRAKVEISIENSPLDTEIEINLPNRNDSASVMLSNGNLGVDLELTKGQSVGVFTSILDGDAFPGSRRIEESAPTFVVKSWDGKQVASAEISTKLQKGQAQVVNFSVNPDSGAISTSVNQVVGVKVDNRFIQNVVPSTSTDPIELPMRATAGSTTTTTTTVPAETTTTTTTVAPPAPPTTLAPEAVVVTLNAERFYGDLNSTINDADWAMSCVDSNSSATGCSFLTNALKTSALGDLINLSLTLGQTANVGSYSSETDSGVLSAGLKAIAGWPSNYSAKIILQLNVLPRPLSVLADSQTKVYGDSDPGSTFTTIGLVEGDALSGVLGRAAGENIGTFVINRGTVSAGSNYAIAFTGADLTITTKTLTVTADAQSKVYDSADPVLTYSTVGLKAGDSITGDLVRVVGENIGTFAINQGTVSAGDNYTINFAPANLTITTKTLTITAEAKTKVYDSVDPVLTYTQSGLKLGDSITGDLVRVVGENVGTFAINQGSISAGSNYAIAFTGADLTITTKTLTVTAAAKTKVYDSADPVLTYSTVGLKAGDSLSGALTRDSGDSVGTFAIRVGDLGNTNYSITFNSANLTITAKTLTVIADAKSKIYDSADPVLTYSTIGLKAGDTITGSLTRETGENVGTFAINQGSIAAGSNYTIAFTGADLTVTTKTLTITAAAKTKVFDSVDPVLTYSTVGLKAGDSITGSLTRVVGENVGTFAINQGTVAAGDNYTINFVPANLTITTKTLTITAVAKTKIYDSADPALTYTESGLKLGDSITGDLVRVTGENVGSFAIGQGSVTASSNYTINFVPANLTITTKTLTITAVAKTKIYDSADPALTYTESGLKLGDTITGDLTRDSGENVGSFAINQGSIAASSNYTINFVSANLAITAKPIAVTVDAKSKIYDSGDPALTYSTIGLKLGDSITGDLARDSGENVGTFAINQGSVTAGSNYTISFTGADLTITAKTLTITAVAKTKVYDSVDPALTYTHSGLKSGDSITGLLDRISGENVGTFVITKGLITAGSNYTINFVPANLTITPKTLSVTADAKSKIYDSVDPTLTYTEIGLKSGDRITGLLDRAAGENVGTFAIEQGSVTAGGNYTISFTSADLTITTKTLTITADAQTKVYDSVDPALTYTQVGLKLGDSITGDLVRVTGENVGTFAINQGTVVASSNYAISFVSANLTITTKTLTITADAKSKIYDSVDPVLTYTQVGLKLGDSITGDLTRDSGENVGTFAIGQGEVSAGGNYTINFVPANLTITAKTLTITADAKTKIYDSVDPVLTYTQVGLKLGDSITGDLVRVTGENVGTFAINRGTVSAGSNYTISFTSADLTITAKTLTITAVAKTKIYDSVDPALTYTQVGLKSGDRISGELSRVIGEDVGTFEIKQGTVSAGSNYLITFKSANLTITEKSMTVVVSTDFLLVRIGDAIPKTATYVSKGTVTWSASPAENCTISESGIVKAVSAGFCTVTAKVSANGNYQAGSDSMTFFILPLDN